MPLKQIYNRPPLLHIPHCFPSNGTVRTDDKRIIRLYKKAGQWIEHPCMWEGMFRLACLTKSKPMDEPVSSLIINGIRDTDSGEFSGTIVEQICIARAAFAVYEYNTDKVILKRLASWLRYLEIEFDSLCASNEILYRPADLMELLVRYYQATCLKSILRLCSKLRASSFDWTTVLQTFRSSVHIISDERKPLSAVFSVKPDEMDFDRKEKLISHAEMLADGMRYSLYSGLFSGHNRDLTSGRNLWDYISGHHRALCGGTSSDPFLCGNASDRPVDNRSLSAWTEAFAAQIILADSDWALDELIRIVFNGLDDCLNHEDLQLSQYVNSCLNVKIPCKEPEELYARLTRAVAAAVMHAVAITEKGIRIHYAVPARFLLNTDGQAVILRMDEDMAVFSCSSNFSARVDYHVSRTDTTDVRIVNQGKPSVLRRNDVIQDKSFNISAENEWQTNDGFMTGLNRQIFTEDTHHQGMCFFLGNRLLSVPAEKDHFAYAVTELPVYTEGKASIRLAKADLWRLNGEEIPDIPVLPPVGKETFTDFLIPYSRNAHRISMFPKAEGACLK